MKDIQLNTLLPTILSEFVAISNGGCTASLSLTKFHDTQNFQVWHFLGHDKHILAYQAAEFAFFPSTSRLLPIAPSPGPIGVRAAFKKVLFYVFCDKICQMLTIQ